MIDQRNLEVKGKIPYQPSWKLLDGAGNTMDICLRIELRKSFFSFLPKHVPKPSDKTYEKSHENILCCCCIEMMSNRISVYIRTASSLSMMIFPRFDKVNSAGPTEVALCKRGLFVVWLDHNQLTSLHI